MPDYKHQRLGEFDLIHWIEEQTGQSARLKKGIGDDCAVQQQQSEHDLLTSTDLLIEDVHFRRQWTSMYDLGRKSAAVNISDVAAMGGTPQALYLGLARPDSLTDDEIKDFVSGFIFETQKAGAVLAGGDSCRSPGPLLISVTVEGGVAAGEAIYRNGASYGDAIYVSGTLGDSALALQQLQQGKTPEVFLAGRFHTPTPRVALAADLCRRGWATAMLDVSDGLMADLGHILEQSQVGAELDLTRLPLSDEFAQALEQDPGLIDLALAGGEDYELVFTSPLKDLDRCSDFSPGVTCIGHISPNPGLVIRDGGGSIYRCQRKGFDHFA